MAVPNGSGGFGRPADGRCPLSELAGLPCHADPRDIRDTFEQALEEWEIALPALRRLATRFTAGEVDLAGLASDEWSELEVESVEEQAFVALLPPAPWPHIPLSGRDSDEWGPKRFRRSGRGRDRGGPLEQEHLAEEFESGAPVELPLDLLDAIDCTLDAAGTPVGSEPGGYGVEVPEQVKCETGEAG